MEGVVLPNGRVEGVVIPNGRVEGVVLPYGRVEGVVLHRFRRNICRLVKPSLMGPNRLSMCTVSQTASDTEQLKQIMTKLKLRVYVTII